MYRGINTVDFILHSLEIILQATLQTRLDNQLVGGEVNVVDGDPPRIKKKRDTESSTVENIQVYLRNKDITL